MSTNGANSEDTEMAECDGQKVVTMMDVLQEEQDFEDDANAVLGASDEKNCTYSKGYIKRQAIYACLTCCTEAKEDPAKRAGVCLACSLNCHENHELVELYTKRNFRCDCGNPKFNFHPCQFTPEKNDLNYENQYNQNFSGLYCNCHRPYPDPEAIIEDEEMIQCIICEDWLHASHLDAVLPGNDQYCEMVCKSCMEQNDFLHDYSNLAVNVETGDVDVTTTNNEEVKLSNGDLETEKLINGELLKDTTDKPKNNMNVDEKKTDNCETDQIQEFESLTENEPSDSNNDTDKADVTEDSKLTSDENSHGREKTDTADVTEDPQLTSGETSDGREKTDIADVTEEPKLTSGESSDGREKNDTGDVTKDPDPTSDEGFDSKEKNATTDVTEGSKLTSHESSDDNDDTAVTIEENFKDNRDTLGPLVSENNDSAMPQESNETPTKTPKDLACTENTQGSENVEEKIKKNIQETVKPESSMKNIEISEATKSEEGTDLNSEITEALNQEQMFSKNLEHINISKDKEEEIAKLNSEESTGIENDVTGEDTKTTENDSKPNSTDIEMNEPVKESSIDNSDETENDGKSKTDNTETDKLSIEMIAETEIEKPIENDSKPNSTDIEMNEPVKESSIDNSDETENDGKSKTDNTETNKLSNEMIAATEIAKNVSKIESDKTTKDVNTVEPSGTLDVCNDTVITEAASTENKRKLSTEDARQDNSGKKPKLDEENKCCRPRNVKRVHKGATFWPSNFRQKLCTCSECISMYKDLSVLFLIDPEDTVFAYETLGKEMVDGRATQYEKGLEALSSLGRVQQINALTEYNKMKDKLLDFLKSFKDRKEIVKEDDIKAFFAGMKPKREPDGVYFCR